MAEEEGFEPPRRLLDLPVFETGLFNHLSISPIKKTHRVAHDKTEAWWVLWQKTRLTASSFSSKNVLPFLFSTD